MNCTESLLRNAFETEVGWRKCICNARGASSDRISKNRHSIRVGNTINCNGDLLENRHIQTFLEEVMEKYNISDYMNNTIHTSYEHSYELIVPEDEYNKLKKNLLKSRE